MNCNKGSTCKRSTVNCTSGNCEMNCKEEYTCGYSTVICPSYGYCIFYCNGDESCQHSDFTCSVGGNCTFHFEGLSANRDRIGYNTVITCQENSICSIVCTGRSNSNDDQCSSLHVICPRESGRCFVECSGYEACRYVNIACGIERDCLSCSGSYSCNRATITLSNVSMSSLNCTGRSSCQSARIVCSGNNNCTINCDGQYSCNNARVTCPTGDYSCNILCIDPLSCSNLSITNTHNVNLQCCGSQTRCAGTRVVPTSTECQ